MSWSIYITDPDGYECWVRMGREIGKGRIARFTKKEAEAQVKFMKIGMTQGEDYDEMEIVPTPTGLELKELENE